MLVFKTSALNHSATLPPTIISHIFLFTKSLTLLYHIINNLHIYISHTLQGGLNHEKLYYFFINLFVDYASSHCHPCRRIILHRSRRCHRNFIRHSRNAHYPWAASHDCCTPYLKHLFCLRCQLSNPKYLHRSHRSRRTPHTTWYLLNLRTRYWSRLSSQG